MTTGPLAGWRVLIGRSAGRSGGLIRLFAAAGVTAQAVPLIDIEHLQDSAALDATVMDLSDGTAEWAVFTSVNAVRAVFDRARDLGVRTVIAADTRVAAVGPATAAALQSAGVAVDLQPAGRGSADALADIFPTARDGETVLLPRSERADDTLPDALRRKGFEVRAADAYRTVSRPLPAGVAEDLAAGGYEAVVVTSGSSVPALVAAAPAPATVVVAIGPATTAALEHAGFTDVLTAQDPTDDGIVTALLAGRSRRPGAHLRPRHADATPSPRRASAGTDQPGGSTR